jgi:hypothetical protein
MVISRSRSRSRILFPNRTEPNRAGPGLRRGRVRPHRAAVALAKARAFAVHNRPVQGSKGNYRVNLRHGVSRVRSGMRHTVGIIFHDAT